MPKIDPQQKQLIAKILGYGSIVLICVSLILMAWFWVVQRNEKEVFGVSFSQIQAERYGSNWRENYDALLADLGFKHVRVAAYWNRIEPEKGVYDFSELDYMVARARENNAKLTLTIGQKLIRNPECYYPTWLNEQDPAEVSREVNRMIGVVANRYKDEPVVEAWQLENEFLLKSFGDCPHQNLTNEALDKELQTLKSIDVSRPIILTQSNQSGWPLFGPTADVYGFSMYRWVWGPFGFARYPQSGIYNWFKAATISAYTGQQTKVHELQAEPWDFTGNEGLTYTRASKTMNPRQFAENIEYARQTQMKRIDLWGAEWWYAVLKQGQPEMWQTVKNLPNKQ